MTTDEPTRPETETLTAALERGWKLPAMPTGQLDFAVALIHETRDEPQPPTPEHDEHGVLRLWRGVKIREER